ncbi:LacI family DNA-binding transcriptional regulator [Salmonella enterica subsp. enterica serovar Weltevreden]|nr:LacI family DNA-binding transcriptional regulator [Salmonella enterica subsp. enterica serovar Weltevreden]
MATIKDVASLAGVSTATVSRVINQTARVEPVTRERVEKAMRDPSQAECRRYRAGET